MIAVAMLALAAVLVVVGVAGLTERLPRNRWVGLRVSAIRDTDDAWRVGHRAAGPSLIAAAGPPLLLAVAMIAIPPDTVEDWFLVYAVVGVVTGGLIALAARRATDAVKGPDADMGPDADS